ncbi:hypothetical protein MMC25_003925 [Agyrium rufum]|nr:hypothetical protein [Agyrium rufum]
MDTYEARLETFHKAPSASKRRASNAKGAKGPKIKGWPLNLPTPEQLAGAGLYFRPTTSAPDNVQCYMCLSELDGWDEGDVPILEHRTLAPDCGFAIMLGVEYDISVEGLSTETMDPNKLFEARKATFEEKWPHENKRGWACKAQKMAEGGWYFCPTAEFEDFTKCAFCGLCLDGWEPKDKPVDEHRKRSPDCQFFSLAQPSKPKVLRAKKSRTSKSSKVSRLSTLSNATGTNNEDMTIDGDSAMTDATNTTIVSTSSKAPMKGGKGRKAKAKAQEDLPAIGRNHSVDRSSLGEPEDAGFDIKIATVQIPVKKTRGKKRKSEDMDNGSLLVGDESQMPPNKIRGTRARSSTVKPEQISKPVTREDISIREDTVVITSKPATSKRGAKANGKRVASATRKASVVPTTSQASLGAPIPADEEIDAALEADLNRNMADDDMPSSPEEVKPKTRRLTRTRPSARVASASTALTRKQQKVVDNSAAPVDVPMPDSEGVEDVPSGDASAIAVDEFPSQKRTKGAIAAKIKKGDSAKPKNEANEETFSSTQRSAGDHSDQAYKDTTLQDLNGCGSNVVETVPRSSCGVQVVISSNKVAETTSVNGPLLLAQNLELTSPPTSPEVPRISLESESADNGYNLDMEDVQSQVLNVTPPKDNASNEQQSKDKTDDTSPLQDENPPSHSLVLDMGDPNVVDNPILIVAIPEIGQAINTQKPVTIAKNKVLNSKGASKGRPAKGKAQARNLSPTISNSSAISTAGTRPAVNMDTYMADPRPSTPFSVEKGKGDTPINDAARKAEVSPQPTLSVAATAVYQKAPSPTPSPASSNAENHPPSTLPSAKRPPLMQLSPSKAQTFRIPLQDAPSTPSVSPSRRDNNLAAKVQSAVPWNTVDLENVFSDSDYAAIANPSKVETLETKAKLTSPEKRMTVEEWILYNAVKGEEQLRGECERLVGIFESEGGKALRALEGIVCVD